MTDESKLLFERGHQSIEKFNYFLCTVAGALFAYIAQTYTPQKLDNFFSVLQTISLLLLAVSFCCGIIRIQTANMITRLDYEYLEACKIIANLDENLKSGLAHFKNNTTGETVTRESLQSRRDSLVKEMLEKNGHIPNKKSLARHLGTAQLYLLLAGFLIIFVAKVFQPYQPDYSARLNAIDQTTNRPAQSRVETQASKQTR